MDNQPQTDSSTLRIYSIGSFDNLSKIWGQLVQSAEPKTDLSKLLGMLLGCIGNGVVLIAEQDGEVFGFSAVERMDDDNCVIHTLPVAPAALPCLKVIRLWAVDQGISHIKLVSQRLNGSNFRYIEKSLGFRREAMVFVQHVNLYA